MGAAEHGAQLTGGFRQTGATSLIGPRQGVKCAEEERSPPFAELGFATVELVEMIRPSAACGHSNTANIPWRMELSAATVTKVRAAIPCIPG